MIYYSQALDSIPNFKLDDDEDDWGLRAPQRKSYLEPITLNLSFHVKALPSKVIKIGLDAFRISYQEYHLTAS